MRSEQAEQKAAENLFAVHKIISSKLPALKLLISAAGVLISPRWLTQLLVCGSQLVMCSDKAPRVLERGATAESSKPADAQLRSVLAKAWQLECFDPRLVLFRTALEVLSLRVSKWHWLHIPFVTSLAHLLIFLFSRPTSTGNTYVTFLKAFSMMTRLSRVGLGGMSALSVSLH